MKHYQESALEFRKRLLLNEIEEPGTPRGLVIYQYGQTVEACVEAARETFGLGEEWEVISWSRP
jgi:hypothetical protein